MRAPNLPKWEMEIIKNNIVIKFGRATSSSKWKGGYALKQTKETNAKPTGLCIKKLTSEFLLDSTEKNG